MPVLALRGYVPCESCGGRAKIVCAGLVEAALNFCGSCYIDHVKSAHRGEPLPGCLSIAEAGCVGRAED